MLWLDPGEPAVHDHVMRVVADIVQRYDIDGIHADDYFYPYPADGRSESRRSCFPTTRRRAERRGLTSGDWRRANVDRFVERLYREVHALKPTLRVGISPFGIWRPGSPTASRARCVRLRSTPIRASGCSEGWVDYLAPQLYWAISAPQQSFPALLDWWMAQNVRGRHVWPGLAAYRVGDGTSSAFSTSEIPSQVSLTRKRAGGTGHLLYNTTSTLTRSGGAVAASLAADLYRLRAIPPASPWLDGAPPPAPLLAVASGWPDVDTGMASRRAGGSSGSSPAAAGRRAWCSAPSDRSGYLTGQRGSLVNAIDVAGNASGIGRVA